MTKFCPPNCGGCSCHISPPCTHCVDHGCPVCGDHDCDDPEHDEEEDPPAPGLDGKKGWSI